MKKYILPLMFGIISLASCNYRSVKGDGHMVSKSYDLKGFTDVEASSSVKVYLAQGAAYSIQVDAEQNILEQMQVRLEGKTLDIDFKDHINVSPTRDIVVHITAPEFRNLDGSGACTFISEGVLRTNILKIELSGASNTDLSVETQKLEVEASGASEITLKGKTRELSLSGSGSMSASCFGLLSDRTKVEISGAGDAEVNAASVLKVDISGAGSVTYKGSPATIEKDISGAGSVHKAD